MSLHELADRTLKQAIDKRHRGLISAETYALYIDKVIEAMPSMELKKIVEHFKEVM